MIILTGESHLGAIRRGAPDHPAIKYWPLGMGGAVATPFFTHDANAKSVSTVVSGWHNRVFSKETLSIEGTQALVGLSIPLNTSRILRDYAWNTHVPWHLRETENETALSDAVVDALMEQDYKHALGFVAALRACDIDVVVIEGPHFFESAPYLKHKRLDVCRYIDAHYRSIVREKLGAMDVNIIDQRPQTLTKDGNTKPKFSHEDPKDTHHASAKLGAMVFEDLTAYGKKTGFL